VELLLSWDLVCFWNIWTLLFGITDAVYRLLYAMYQSIASYRHSGKNSAYDRDVGKPVALGFPTHVNMIARGGHCGTQTIYQRYPNISPTFNVLYVYETKLLEYTTLYVEIADSAGTVICISISQYLHANVITVSASVFPSQTESSIPSLDTSATQTSTLPHTSHSSSKAWIAGVVIGTVAVVFVFALLLFWIYSLKRRLRNAQGAEVHNLPFDGGGKQSLQPVEAGFIEPRELPVVN
jgi:hypothetical protein